MGLLTWIVVGLVAGFIAEFAVGGGIGGIGIQRFAITILLGVGGALLGGWVASSQGWGDVTGFNIRSLVIATLGAIVVVLAWHAISNRGGRRHGFI